MTSRLRSASKKRLSSLFFPSSSSSAHAGMPNSPSHNSKKDPPFLHLKFTSGRPPPHGHHLPFAHELGPEHVADLSDSLKTDVQRKGIARWVEQNFKEGAYIWEVVHERKERDGMYGVVTKNWARSVGDPVRPRRVLAGCNLVG